ncbi:MAG: DNA-binding protein [Actinobacteria bacterium]|nr:DNA-binding protein [Actinomycetota bacterium]
MASDEGNRIQVCGRVVARIDGRRVESDLPGRQGRVLFVYLVVNRRRAVVRDELVAALWPEEPPATPDASLSALLSKLRRAIGGERLEGRSALQLRLAANAWVDLEAATEALHRAESAVGRGDWTSAWGPARVAQHIAIRPFLVGEDARWIDERRRQLDEIYLRALEVGAQASLQIGGSELDTAERSARSLVERAPYRESGYRYLMQAMAQRENVAEALRVYESLRTRLRDDLGASPAPATQAAYKEILARS